MALNIFLQPNCTIPSRSTDARFVFYPWAWLLIDVGVREENEDSKMGVKSTVGRGWKVEKMEMFWGAANPTPTFYVARHAVNAHEPTRLLIKCGGRMGLQLPPSPSSSASDIFAFNESAKNTFAQAPPWCNFHLSCNFVEFLLSTAML